MRNKGTKRERERERERERDNLSAHTYTQQSIYLWKKGAREKECKKDGRNEQRPMEEK